MASLTPLNAQQKNALAAGFATNAERTNAEVTSKESEKLLLAFMDKPEFLDLFRNDKWIGLKHAEWKGLSRYFVTYHNRANTTPPAPQIREWTVLKVQHFAHKLISGWPLFAHPSISSIQPFEATRQQCGVFNRNAPLGRGKPQGQSAKRKASEQSEDAEAVDRLRAKGAPVFCSITKTMHLPQFIFTDAKSRMAAAADIEFDNGFTDASHIAYMIADYDYSYAHYLRDYNGKFTVYCARWELCLSKASDAEKTIYWALKLDKPILFDDLPGMWLSHDIRKGFLHELANGYVKAVAEMGTVEQVLEGEDGQEYA